MTTEINIDTAAQWLENHYKDVPGIWGEFDQEDAAETLCDIALEDKLDSYDDVTTLTVMCIMADSRM